MHVVRMWFLLYFRLSEFCNAEVCEPKPMSDYRHHHMTRDIQQTTAIWNLEPGNLETLMMLIKHGWLGNLHLSMKRPRNIIQKGVLTENSCRMPHVQTMLMWIMYRGLSSVSSDSQTVVHHSANLDINIGRVRAGAFVKRNSDDFWNSSPVSLLAASYLYSHHPFELSMTKNDPAVGANSPICPMETFTCPFLGSLRP